MLLRYREGDGSVSWEAVWFLLGSDSWSWCRSRAGVCISILYAVFVQSWDEKSNTVSLWSLVAWGPCRRCPLCSVSRRMGWGPAARCLTCRRTMRQQAPVQNHKFISNHTYRFNLTRLKGCKIRLWMSLWRTKSTALSHDTPNSETTCWTSSGKSAVFCFRKKLIKIRVNVIILRVVCGWFPRSLSHPNLSLSPSWLVCDTHCVVRVEDVGGRGIVHDDDFIKVATQATQVLDVIPSMEDAGLPEEAAAESAPLVQQVWNWICVLEERQKINGCGGDWFP